LEQNDPMLTLGQLISEATALLDAAKALLIDKIAESMASQIDSTPQTLCDRDILIAGVQKAQERIAEVVGVSAKRRQSQREASACAEAFLQENSCVVQTIPGGILAQIRQLSQP
jgi:hypothetical protein